MSKWRKLTVVISTVVALVGCSAGGGVEGGNSGTTSGSGSTGGTTTPASITLSLSSPTVASAAPATVTATVDDSAGKAVAGAVVNFTVNPAIGTLSASAALTDSSGIASVSLSPATAATSGADTITASATVGSATVTATRGYQLSATTASFTSFTANTGTSATSKLPAYAQAVLTANLSGVSVSSPTTLNVTSSCVALGKATISPSTTTNSSGVATFTYKDTGGCGSTLSTDTVTIGVTGGSTSTTAQLFLTSPTANSITFTSATPSTIYLKGSGNVESSNVKFEVVDTDGNPLPGQVVTLNLSTFAGGLLLNQGSAPVVETSDSNGFVSVIVNSGTVPTPVRVTASLASGVSTVSSNLAVVTGLPSQLNFSLSQKTINIEGWNYDGTSNNYTIYAADRSGNPVPDGTTVLFWAEGGQVEGSVTTATSGGISSATASYVSAEPRPSDARVTVLAYAIGEESFVDLAGTNVYQAGDPFQDLGNVVKSKLYDGIYDSANDEVVSLSALGASSSGTACVSYAASYPQFALNNQIPNQPSTCDGTWTGKTYVRRDVETVLSSVTPNPFVSPVFLPSSCLAQGYNSLGQLEVPIYDSAPTLHPAVRVFPLGTNGTIYVGNVTSGAFDIRAADNNPVRINPMAFGSTVTATPVPNPGLSSAAVATSSGTYVYPSTASAQYVPINFAFTSTTVTPTSGAASGVATTTYATSGALTLNFTSSPSGTSTSFLVNVQASTPNGTCQ